jgi:predicted DNA-binding protein (UPF0251 family)
LTANNFVRSEIRRQRREQEAYMETILNESGTEVWPRIAPLLDTAVANLNEKDRRAIVLRFYEGRNLQEVGAALGASEEAAKKRVNRAVEKLQKFFFKRGVTSTTAIIAGAISTNSVQAAPVALAKTVAAVAITKGVAASSSTLTLIKGALKIMAWTKAKTAAAAGVVLILAAGTTTVIVKRSGHHPPPVKVEGTSAEAESFRQESIAHMNQGKQWVLAFRIFAGDHRDEFPKDFGQVKTERYVHGLSDSNWEIASGGTLTSFAKPAKTILLREKESRPSPDGNYLKAYVFTDGHVEMVSSPDDDFAAVEKQRGFLIQQAK